MNLLLDTHSLLWFLNGDSQLSKNAKAQIMNPITTKFISIASIWEMAIKINLKKLVYPKGLPFLINLIEENGFEFLPITTEHILSLASLENIHKDPFDRVLIAQCISEKIPILTKDENIQKYKALVVIW